MQKRIAVVLMLLGFALVTALPAATPAKWKQVSPAGGSFADVVCEPRMPDACYAIAERGLYRSADGGRSWTLAYDRYVYQVVVHPLTGRLYFLVRTQGREIWTSSNHGKTFTSVARIAHASRIAVSRSNPHWLFAFVWDRQLQLSTDEGSTWTRIQAPVNHYYYDIVVSPFQSKTWYLSGLAITGNYGQSEPLLLITRDAGSTWQLVVRGARAYCGYRFFQDPEKPDRVIAFHCGGLDLLTSCGFQPLSRIKGALKIAEAHGELYLLNTIHGRSDDPIPSRELFHSTNHGKDWIPVVGDLNLLKHSITGLAVSAGDSPLLLSTAGGGMYHCEITGTKCEPSNDGITGISEAEAVGVAGPQGQVFAIMHGTVDLDDYQVTMGSFLYSSIDGGQHWQDITLSSGLGDKLSGLVVHPSDNSTLAVFPGFIESGLQQNTREFFISHDAGKTWIHRKTPIDFNNLTFDPLNSQSFILSNLHNSEDFTIQRTTDSGSTFGRIIIRREVLSDISAVILDPLNPEILYLSGARDLSPMILKSKDRGKTFVDLRPRIKADFNELLAWIALPSPNGFLAIDKYGTFYETADGAHSWRKISTINAQGYSGSIYSADHAGTHYLAIYANHLYESMNGALKWEDISPPSGVDSHVYIIVNAISDPRNSTLFAATFSGLYLRKQ